MTKTESKMTRRSFFETIAAMTELDVELREFAEHEIEKIDAELAKRRAATAKKAEENEPLLAQLLELLDTEIPRSTADLAAEVSLSTPKVSPLLRKLVDAGKAVSHDFKPTGKGRSVKGYTRV